jgi:hypothetical protein
VDRHNEKPEQAYAVAIRVQSKSSTKYSKWSTKDSKWSTKGGREMASQLGSAGDRSSVIPFAPGAKSAISDDADELDQAGQTILKLLHKAAGVAEQNSRHALDMAQKLSHQLRATEDRVAELEAEVELYREKADRAEQWLHKVYTEIEDRFIRQPEESRLATPGVAARRT